MPPASRTGIGQHPLLPKPWHQPPCEAQYPASVVVSSLAAALLWAIATVAPAAPAAATESVGNSPATRNGGCGPIGCGVLFHHAVGNRTAFTIRVAPERLLWGFEGYGIVAIWAIPDG